jgi:hypothetical protein
MNLRSIVAAAPEMALRGTVLRLVQQQGINSLEPLVDNLEQLARLEAMVATSQPLLTTPFRYPPLRHGSPRLRAHPTARRLDARSRN